MLALPPFPLHSNVNSLIDTFLGAHVATAATTTTCTHASVLTSVLPQTHTRYLGCSSARSWHPHGPLALEELLPAIAHHTHSNTSSSTTATRGDDLTLRCVRYALVVHLPLTPRSVSLPSPWPLPAVTGHTSRMFYTNTHVGGLPSHFP